VIAEVIEDLEMAGREDKLDPVFDCRGFGRGGNFLGCPIRLLHVLGLAEDIISASGERVLTERLRFHAE
jgi:hypothetical protein